MNSFSSAKKLHAFTLTELLIGMIVSGIVISCVWTAFQVVSSLAHASLSPETEVEEISFFKRCIAADFQSARNVFRTEEGVAMSFADPTNGLNYIFAKGYVLRKSGERVDTFRVQASEVAALNTHNPDDESRINQLKCTILINGVDRDLILNRTLSSRDMMKIND